MAKGFVIYEGKRHEICAEIGESLLSALRREGILVNSPCGGNGTCGKCRVTAQGKFSAIYEDERRFLHAQDLANGVRLACKTKIEGDFQVILQKEALPVETGFQTISYDISPMVISKRTDEKSFFYINDVCVDESVSDAKNFGLAVDIGTTTVAVYLCDLDEGRVIAQRGFRNPQSAYGADVISRIDKIMKDPNALYEEQTLIIKAIGAAANDLAVQNGGTARDIRAAVFCGNTVMQHIAAGIDPSSIANAPFIAPTLFGSYYDAKTIGLSISQNAKIYFAPCFASYVGGDIACGMIAAGLDKVSDNVLFIDIGTNGEIGLSSAKRLYFCSAAAGPAFEGAHIACGMAGTAGAVSKIYVDGDTIRYETVAGAEPCGICGSGIIDAVAVMLDIGLLDETGCIADESEIFSDFLGEDDDGNPVFMIDKKYDIYITGRDIREIQLAKAAIAAGIRTLLHKAQLDISDITAVVLAGGFGSHIDPKNACRIGLIPRELDGKTVSFGNTAGAGAVAILLGKEPRDSARTICEKSDYTELSVNPFFMDAYIEEMMFEE